jgi:structural maintenance of chromosome 4
MFELADYLVGIYKVEDCTNSVTIRNYDKQRVLGLGEKESEKENQDENSPNLTHQDSMLSCRTSQANVKEGNAFEKSASQPMETEG